MATSPINAASTTPTTFSSSSRGLNDLSPEDFFKLLITELQQQDPFKPNDTNQLVQEMSTIRQMDMATSMNKTLGAFAEQQRVGSATGMIGRYVQGVVVSGAGTDAAPQLVDGMVVGVQFSSSGEAVLELDGGIYLPVANVTMVRSKAPESAAAPGASADPDQTAAAAAAPEPTIADVAASRMKAGVDGMLSFLGFSQPGAVSLNATA